MRDHPLDEGFRKIITGFICGASQHGSVTVLYHREAQTEDQFTWRYVYPDAELPRPLLNEVDLVMVLEWYPSVPIQELCKVVGNVLYYTSMLSATLDQT